MGLFEKVTFEQRPEGGKGGSHAEAGHARCTRGAFRRPVWLKRVRGAKQGVTKNWVHLLMGIKPKDTTKPKIRRRKDLLLSVANMENIRDLSQSSVSLNSKIGEVLS